MTHSRRHFLVASAAAGAVTLLPFTARAAAHGGDRFETDAGPLTVHPIEHASFLMETPAGVIYVDPVGDAAQYGDFPKPDLILITHEHGDHYNAETLEALAGDDTQIITNPAVFDMLPDGLKSKASQLANGEDTEFNGLPINAIPAYNTTEDRKKFHPEGRDNGYILGFDGFRVYISGDTEDTPEMRELTDISLAFVCMNLPFTMDSNAAASAVAEFKPTYVYPYHYRGKDGGTQDPEEFAKRVGTDVEVKMGGWYDE
ncbi:MBL fold metallo-hydrolase [Sulfitobacter sp. PS-8MA]|uniref:MBL fold metallo-hydrolase n=1 Tax=Sulfitobacter sp. PS-8MA TaxID=3237707 RepID=UPI0034C647F6